jgi:hypothetical protein
VSGEHPVHPFRQIGRYTRLYNQVNVVGHQACRENRQLEPILRTCDERLKLCEIVLRMEDLRFLVATIYYVVAAVSDNCPSRPWHRAKVPQGKIDALR